MTAIAQEAAVGLAADGLLDTPYRTYVVWCRRLEV